MRAYFLSLIAGVIALCGNVFATERVAIVVGNGAYAHATKLENPVNDARAVAKMLEKIGFDVITVEDAGVETMYEKLDLFGRKAAKARIGLFYFAGHGMMIDNRNYLIPIDAELERQSQMRTQAVSVEAVLDEMRRVKLPAKMVILDCCRNNPLKRSWLSTRSTGKGLAAVGDSDLPEATMILFSAAPGQEALDGTGGNSPFTAALVSELPKPSRNALDAFYAVSDKVVKETGLRQEPWVKVDGAGRAFRSFDLVKADIPTTSTLPETKPMTETVPTKKTPQMKPEVPRTPGMRIVPDEYTSIQSAIEAAESGDTILIKTGIYTELLTVDKPNLEFRGENRGTTILRHPGNTKEETIDDFLKVNAGAENTRISDITFEFLNSEGRKHENINKDTIEDLVTLEADNILVSNCTFRGGNFFVGLRFATEDASATARNCEFLQCAFGIVSGKKNTSMTVEDCLIKGIEGNGIAAMPGSLLVLDGVSVSETKQAGIYVTGSHSNYETGVKTRIDMRDSQVVRSDDSGIIIMEGVAGSVTNCSFDDNGVCGALLLSRTTVEFKDNRCRRNSLHGISIENGALPIVEGNVCTDTQIGSGILAVGAESKPTIVNNKCDNNNSFGIAVERACYPAKFEGNTVNGNKIGGIDRNIKVTN